MKKIIKLEATIDLSKTPNEIKVKPIVEDYWMDLGFWLEVTGFMAYQAMKYREWTPKEMEEYIKDYIGKCLRDYKIKIK